MRSSTEQQSGEMKAWPKPARAWARLEVPAVVACWLLGYWWPWAAAQTGNTWLALSVWAAAHGLRGLEAGSRIVTMAVACCALLGAALRVGPVAGRRSAKTLRQAGLLAVGLPLCVLLPPAGAIFFLGSLCVLVIAGWHMLGERGSRVEALRRRLLRESFPVLAAVCFLTLSWQYNAQWLLRGLLVAAGAALVARAALPANG